MNNEPTTLRKSGISMTSRAREMFDKLSNGTTSPLPSKGSVVAAKPKGSTEVTARLDALDEGVCPYCSSNMRHTLASGHPVWLCDKDRHVVPVRNPHLR